MPPGDADPAQIEKEFFKTLDQHKADAVVLDLTASHDQGITAIRRIRQHSAVPIVVVCTPEDNSVPGYRQAGAAACLNPPIDLMRLKEILDRAGKGEGADVNGDTPSDAVESLRFSGFVLRPREQRLTGPSGADLALSTIESRVLSHLAGTPGVVWPAKAIAEAVDADRDGKAATAIAPVIARLREKLETLAGPAGPRLIKTETGRGYMFAAEPVLAWPAGPAARSA
jgi:two-component system OmpR family response regulator